MPTAVRHLIIAFSLFLAVLAAGQVVDTVRIVPGLNNKLPMCHKPWALMCWRLVRE